jgi:hypothetical protein
MSQALINKLRKEASQIEKHNGDKNYISLNLEAQARIIELLERLASVVQGE